MNVNDRQANHKQRSEGCCAAIRAVVLLRRLTQDEAMPQVKQASKRKRGTKAAVSALGAAGLTFSLLGSATASAVPTADVAQTTAFAPNEAITLGEEEIADISLATFYVFDKENVGGGVQVARRGCDGCRGGAVRGCAVRASAGCGGCGGCGCACHAAQL